MGNYIIKLLGGTPSRASKILKNEIKVLENQLYIMQSRERELIRRLPARDSKGRFVSRK